MTYFLKLLSTLKSLILSLSRSLPLSLSLPLIFASWWLAWKYQDEFITDWDAFDYTVYAVQGWPSALGLGRSLFIGYNHLLWTIAHRWFDLPPEEAYLLLRYAVIAQSGPAIAGIYLLCKELTASRLAASFGALLVAASPFFIIYSGRGMSEIPAILLFSWSLWWILRSLRLGRLTGFLMGAFLFGLSANMREFAVFYLPLIPLAAIIQGYHWKLGLKALGLAILGALSGMIFWTLYSPDSYWPAVINWYTLSARERELHPVTTQNLFYFINFAFNCSCAVALISPFALLLAWLKKRWSALFLFGCFGLLANLFMMANHDLPVNPRYLLTGLLGLAAVCGWSLAKLIDSHRVWAIPLLLGLATLTKGTYNNMSKELYGQQWAARAARSYIAKIESLPWNSAFIVGSRTPLANLYSYVGARPYWKIIPSGAGWPDDRLDETIDELLRAGREVYVDFDPELWQLGLRAENREGEGLEMIKRQYRLIHISDLFYRIDQKKNQDHERSRVSNP
jgi:Dolichyl-phosphate-mannose-protein mannosyltransferase